MDETQRLQKKGAAASFLSDKVERIRHLEASLGVIAILIADKVALLISDIGDDGVVGFDLDARRCLVSGHEFIHPARFRPHEQKAPIVVTDLVQVPFGRQPLERIVEASGNEKNIDRLAVPPC